MKLSAMMLVAWSAAFAVLTLSGCGGAYDSAVSGLVTLDGNAISRGTVAFHPIGGGPPAYARIEESGHYAVRTGREEGLPPGEYEVSVVANEAPAELFTTGGGPPPPGKSITPPWYRSKDTSGLRFTVESGDNEINLELTSKSPAGWNPRGQ